MRNPNYFIKTDREKDAVKAEKSQHVAEMKRNLDPNWKQKERQMVTTHKLTH